MRGLARRLSQSLSADAAQALAVVAAAGRIAVADAVVVLDSLADAPKAVDEAVLAGVVVESNGQLTPAHPLIGAAAVDAVPPSRRLQAYQRLAATSNNPERYAHFATLAAGPGPDPELATALDAAAATAHGRAGNAAAGQFAAQAVAFTPEFDEPAVVRRRIRAGELLFLAGDLKRSLAHLAALDIDRFDTPDLERALPLLVDMTDLVRGPTEANAIVRHAVAATGQDNRRHALALALAADGVYGDPAGRQAAAVEAIACAEVAGAAAEPTLHRATINLVVAKVAVAEGLDAALLDRAQQLETRVPIERIHDTADLHRGAWSRYLEDVATSRATLQRCTAKATDAGADFAQSTFLEYLAGTEELAGNYAAARAALEESDAIRALHDWPPGPWQVEPRCELLISAGDYDAALDLVGEHLVAEHLAEDDAITPPRRFVAALVRGRVASWRGDRPAVVRHLNRAAALADQFGWIDPGLRHRLDVTLAEAYVGVGRRDDAALIATTLRDIGARLGRPALIGDAARIDALAAAERGDLQTAAESAQTAVAAHAAAPLRLELARSLLTLGRIERRRRARRRSRKVLRQAWALADDIGHRPLLAEVEEELPPDAGQTHDRVLTATEQRVAELIARGTTNRDAAAALFVSVRTVETHAAAIYRKLGVRNRSELAHLLADTPPADPTHGSVLVQPRKSTARYVTRGYRRPGQLPEQPVWRGPRSAAGAIARAGRTRPRSRTSSRAWTVWASPLAVTRTASC